jgi:hypothetical protein
VGRPVAELAPEQSDELHWSLNQAARLSAVDRRSGFVPTYISGRLELPPDVDGDDLLLVVNGTVGGTGLLTRDSSTSGEMHGLVAEELIVEGANEVSILVPAPDGGGWLTGTSADITVEFIADDGRRLDIRPEGNRRVEITGVTRIASGWRLTGWAADVAAKVPADRIYVFAGDELLASGEPNADNKNVTRWFKSDDLLRSGFTYEIAATQIPEGLQRLTIVAEFGDQAVESPASLTG